MRTEIARIEIKNQEKIISSSRPSPKAIESKEMKFIINSHRTEIQELKAEIEKYKVEIKEKEKEILKQKEDKQVLSLIPNYLFNTNDILRIK